jgi:hypothetical protein
MKLYPTAVYLYFIVVLDDVELRTPATMEPI